MANQEQWLSIIDYSIAKNKSISTIRRYIKSGRLKYKEIDGKYLIKTKVSDEIVDTRGNHSEIISELKNRIRSLEEENIELRMLVELYEQNLH